jgi:hypothetical protein
VKSNPPASLRSGAGPGVLLCMCMLLLLSLLLMLLPLVYWRRGGARGAP